MVSGKSDLNLRYRLGSARRAELESYPAGWRGFGTRIVRVPYTEGTLVIGLRDPTTRSLVWRAIVSVEKSDATKLEGKLDDMVRKSLEKFHRSRSSSKPAAPSPQIPRGPALDELKQYFNDDQIVELTLAISIANFTNRFNDTLLNTPDIG